jgi:transcriptional repressor NrdR
VPLICPFCGHHDSKVIDSRSSESGRVIRRRRQCLKCDKRFTTYERVEQAARLMVIKRGGTRVPFSAENIMRGVMAACGKRPVPAEARERLVAEVEEELHREFDREVESRIIGERVMQKLRDVDDVAYIRFASEYHKFKSVEEVATTVAELAGRVKDVKDQQRLF